MLAERIVGRFTADERVTHLPSAVAHTVGRGDGELRLNEAHPHLPFTGAQSRQQRVVNTLDFALHAKIALGITLIAHDPD